jgi:hypothetical protein
MGYLDYNAVEPILRDAGYLQPDEDFENTPESAQIVSMWMRDVGVDELLKNHERYFDTDAVENDLRIGDWFMSVKGKHGFYIFEAENIR